MSENKDIPSKKSWLKSLFKGNTSSPSQHDRHADIDINDDFWNCICSTAASDVRINKLSQFESFFQSKQLERGVVEKIWMETKDLLQMHVPQNIRLSYFKFLSKLIKSQYKQLSMLRPMFYLELKVLDYHHHQDVLYVMLIINALTDSGKNLTMLEQEIGLHLVKWMDQLGGDETYLSLLQNIIKFNSSHLGKETIQGIVQHLCKHCGSTSSAEELKSLLKVLDAIICYNCLPQTCLYAVTVTLCHTLNLKDFCDLSWKLMRNLLGTHLGHSCVTILCKVLQDQTTAEFGVLRSAVFFIGMGLWGSKGVSTLMHKPQSVLPSFKCALKLQNPILCFEICITCDRLIKKFGHELHASAWDTILSIIVHLLQIVESGDKSEHYLSLHKAIHELLTLIENLYKAQAFNGSPDELFDILEQNMKQRPYDSVVLLITYRSQTIKPVKDDWIVSLFNFVNRYYCSGMHIEGKLKIFDILNEVVISNLELYEKDLVDTVILPTFQTISEETPFMVQENAIKLLFRICQNCKTNRCLLILRILEDFVSFQDDFDDPKNNLRISCIECVLNGLIDLFLKKFYGDCALHSVDAFQLLVRFLNNFYQCQSLQKRPTIFGEIRAKVFDALFQIRVNVKLQVSLNSHDFFLSNVICYTEDSSFDRMAPMSTGFKQKRASATDVVLKFKDAFSCFIDCITREHLWPLLQNTINNLCVILDNKALILTVPPPKIDQLAESLTSLVSNSNRAMMLSGTPAGFKRADLLHCALTAIRVLSSFHEYITISRQRQILRCLESGFNTKCAKQCISVTTLCIMEMKSECLLRVLPSILLRLSQMSATVHLATAVLELLSSLGQLPHLYSNFVDDQYMSVFKIALQHADPSKFSLYVVSLAHHVINMWFIKCRLAFRPDFVRYITLSLQSAYRHSNNNTLQHNLIESCIDVMARYTYSNSMPVTKKSVLQRSFSKTGQRATWLIGNRLITIKTEGRFSTSDNKHADVVESLAQNSTENLQNDQGAFGSEKKISVEAPGKLQSTDSSSVSSSRHRHKSSAAVLRRSMEPGEYHNFSLTSTQNGTLLCGDNVHHKSCLKITDEGSSWAEICIRRPSGNTSWLLNAHQLKLLPESTETFNDALLNTCTYSSSTSDLRSSNSGYLNEDSSDQQNIQANSTESVSRQRSHTVSSSQDYKAGAAARAAARAKSRGQASSNAFQPSSTQQTITTNVNNVSHNDDCTLSPQFVFLQLFHSAIVADGLQRPLRLPDSATIDRAVNVLDLIPPYDTWQTGVVYVRPGQTDDGKAILYNQHGSSRYQNMLSSLGKLISLANCDMSHTYLGGLDQNDGDDGEFTYVWQENIMQMVFHIATLMPNRESGVGNKQRHIGNDYVMIVYDDNDSQVYVPGSIVKGQFLSVEIIISPLDLGYNLVKVVYRKPELESILQINEKRTVSDQNLGVHVRQLALHANMTAAAFHKKSPEQFVSKALSRLKQIKHIRSRAMQETTWKDESKAMRYGTAAAKNDLYSLEEFSDYV